MEKRLITVYYDDNRPSMMLMENIAENLSALRKSYQFKNIKINTQQERNLLRSKGVTVLPVILSTNKIVPATDCIVFIKSLVQGMRSREGNQSVYEYMQDAISRNNDVDDDRDDRVMDAQTMQARMQEFAKRRDNRLNESKTNSTKKSNAGKVMNTEAIDDQFIREDDAVYDTYVPSGDNILSDWYDEQPEMQHTKNQSRTTRRM